MANLLKDGLAFLTTQMQQYASEPVTYTRGVDSVLVLAVFGRKLLKLDDGMGGTRLEWTDLDFLIAADADFAFTDGPPITPARGTSRSRCGWRGCCRRIERQPTPSMEAQIAATIEERLASNFATASSFMPKLLASR